MKKLYTLAAALLMTASLWAQSPEKMSYQAVVRDASNALVTTQAVGMQISILQGGATGTAVYVETQSPNTNANGLVSLEIGTGSIISGDFTTIDWGNDTYFIKTETDPTGGTNYTITGTSQLMSVPYALHAKTAESITGTVNYTETDPVFGTSIAGGVTAVDTANWNNHTVDTDTQLDSTGVANLGYEAGAHTVDTDTHIDAAGVTALGFTSGVHTVDTDTQLDSTGVANLGYEAGAHAIDTDTHIDAAGITALGFTSGTHTVNTDTQLDSTGIANLGFVAGSSLDNDSTNEYVDSLYLSGTDLIISQANGVNKDTTDISSLNHWNKTGNDLFYNSGKVGFGTNTPLYSLHVLNNTNSRGIYALSNTTVENIGIEGVAHSTSSNTNSMTGVSGIAEGDATTGTGKHTGVFGKASGAGNLNRGVEGYAESTTARYNQGVFGYSFGSGTQTTGYNAGVLGEASNHSIANYAVLGLTGATGNTNWGGAFFAYGNVSGTKSNIGVYGYAWGADENIAVKAYAKDDLSAINYGVYSEVAGITGSKAGYFIGDVAIQGNLSVTGSISKGSGTFKIDHPKDPENKYLIHSFVESPDMINVYNGNITTNSKGIAIVELPDYFEISNKDFKYQLTPIGQFAQCIIKEEVSNNSFIIETSIPNVKVSWQVTGVRNDPYAKQNRVVPVVEKEHKDKGLYLHPAVYGESSDKAIYKPLGNQNSKQELENLKKSASSKRNK